MSREDHGSDPNTDGDWKPPQTIIGWEIDPTKRYQGETRYQYYRRHLAGHFHRISHEQHLVYGTWTLALATWAVAVLSYCSMQDADRAATAQNRISRAALTSVQRAFITVDTLQIVPERLVNGDIITWIINPVVVNSGNTPARNFYYDIGFGGPPFADYPPNKPKPRDPPEFPNIVDVRSKKNMVKSVIGPRARIVNFTTLNGVMAWLLKSNDLQAQTLEFVWGAFNYGDVFDPNAGHITEFCFILARPTLVGNTTVPYERCAHHNCVDEECDQ